MWNIGRLFDVDIELHWSVLFIIFIFAFSLNTIFSGAIIGVLVLISVLVHEIAHVAVGQRFGIEFDKITLYGFGGLAHMESEPNTGKSEFLMALAGPVSNFFIFAIGYLVIILSMSLLGITDVKQLINNTTLFVIWQASIINFMLGIFNILPAYPIDGGRMLRAVIWMVSGNFWKATYYALIVGMIMGSATVFFGLFFMFGFDSLSFSQKIINGVVIIFIGIALYRRASVEKYMVGRVLKLIKEFG